MKFSTCRHSKLVSTCQLIQKRGCLEKWATHKPSMKICDFKNVASPVFCHNTGMEMSSSKFHDKCDGISIFLNSMTKKELHIDIHYLDGTVSYNKIRPTGTKAVLTLNDPVHFIRVAFDASKYTKLDVDIKLIKLIQEPARLGTKFSRVQNNSGIVFKALNSKNTVVPSFLIKDTKSILFDDVTLCTQLDTRRIHSLLLMRENYSGPISATIYVRDRSVEIPLITRFWVESLQNMPGPIAIHIVYNLKSTDARDLLYPTNFLRNVAIDFASTKYIILLEADMIIPKSLRKNLMRHLRMGHIDSNINTAYILPLWYYNGPAMSVKNNIPGTKIELNKTHYFPCPYDSHKFMDYSSWMQLSSSKPIKLPTYKHGLQMNQEGQLLYGYEPYVLVNRASIPRFQESIKCFADKVNMLSAMTICSNFEYWVFTDVYIVNYEDQKRLQLPTYAHYPSCDSFIKSWKCSYQLHNQNLLPITYFKYTRQSLHVQTDVEWIKYTTPNFIMAYMIICSVLLLHLFCTDSRTWKPNEAKNV